MIAAGRLRHRVEIQQATETDNGRGETEIMWTTVATRWAAIDDSGGRELYRAQRVNPLITAVVTIRHYLGLTSKFRAKHGDRILNINAVQNPERISHEMQLWCIEEL